MTSRPSIGADATGARRPLVGRHDELASAAAALSAPGCTGLVIVGDSGVGKSRLAQECEWLAGGAGFAVTSVLATRAASSIPLGALAPLLPAGLGSLGEGLDALRAAAAAIVAQAADRPLMVVVDDAHLLDHISATIVHQLAGRAGVFVVATVRSGEPVPDAITALWKDGPAIRLDLAPLGREDAERAAEHLLGGRLHPGLARELWRLSAGNALFLRELVEAARQSGRLCMEDERWRLDGRLPTSARLSDLIEARVGDLDPDERRVLELVAFGEPVLADIVTRVSSAAALEALERRGLVTEDAEAGFPAVRLGHPLYGEVVRAQTPSTRIPRLHAALADALAASGAHGRADVLRIATWRLTDPAQQEPTLFMEGAREARAVGDLDVAGRLAAAAHRAGGGATALGLFASVTAEAGDPRAAEDNFAAAHAEAVTDAERATVAMGRSTNMFAGLGLAERAMAINADALTAVAEANWRAELVAHGATFELLLGRPVPALRAVAHLLERAEGRPFVQAAIVSVPALVVTGRCERAATLAESAYAVHSALGLQPELAHPAIHLVGRIFALYEAGRIDDAVALGEFALRTATDLGSTLGEAYFGVQLGAAELAAGRVKDAAVTFDASALLMRELALPGRLQWSLAGATMAHALAGDLAQSDRRLEELDAVQTTERLMEGEVARARAWNAVAHGATSRAHHILARAVAAAAAAGMAGVELSLLHDLTRLGRTDDDHRVDALVPGVEGRLAAVRRDHVVALDDHDGAGLDAAAESFERLGAHLLAADASAHAAAAHDRRGVLRRATASRRRAHELAERCQGARTPALDALGATAVLTEREREIAALAAGGLNNRDIAEQLFVSLRTVENHLHHIYTKLGVVRRQDLVAALDPASARPGRSTPHS
jgi:DNA-binding CsgD family transcriptional regulator